MNLPNMLSLLRIAMIPLVPMVYFSDVPGANLWAAVLYALASLTDILDGYLARRFNQITRLGRVLDPAADKMMGFCVLVCIVVKGLVPPWAAVVFFAKELFMLLGALSQYKRIKDVPPSHFIGKAATALFFLSCFAIMVWPDMPYFWATAAITAALTLNVYAFTLYLARYIGISRK